MNRAVGARIAEGYSPFVSTSRLLSTLHRRRQPLVVPRLGLNRRLLREEGVQVLGAGPDIVVWATGGSSSGGSPFVLIQIGAVNTRVNLHVFGAMESMLEFKRLAIPTTRYGRMKTYIEVACLVGRSNFEKKLRDLVGKKRTKAKRRGWGWGRIEGEKNWN